MVYIYLLKTPKMVNLIKNKTNNKYLFLLFKQKIVYSLHKIESIRHNCSPVILFDKLPCLPISISFDQKVKMNYLMFIKMKI